MGKDLKYPKMSRTNRKRRNGGKKEGNSYSQTVSGTVRGRASERDCVWFPKKNQNQIIMMRKWWRTKCALGQILRLRGRGFRSDAALEAISIAGEERVKNLALYNYPSLSGSLSALFAHLFHSHLNLPCLLLPFSSVEPLR